MGYAGPTLSNPIDLVDGTDRTKEIIKGLKTLLWTHKASSHVINDMAQQVHTYLESDSPSQALWFKRAKYLLVLPMSIYLRNDPPAQPSGPALVWKGLFGSWCRNRLRLFKQRNTHLWYSWLQGKRCSLPLTEEIVEQTYREHFESLTKDDPLTESAAEELIMSSPAFVNILQTIRTGLNKSFKSCTQQYTGHSKLFPRSLDYSASTSASFGCPRSRGGAASSLFEGWLSAYKGCFQDQERLGLAGPTHSEGELFRMDYRYDLKSTSWTVLERRGTFLAWDLCRYRGRCAPLDHHVTTHILDAQLATFARHSEPVLCPLTFEMVPRFEYEVGNDQHDRWSEYVVESTVPDGALPAMIQAVLEPLKVRVISKGPALDYYRVKSLQKATHTIMRELPAFHLIGRKLKSSDLERLRDLALEDSQGDSSDLRWLSVDYSAATDGSSSNLGLAIQRYIIRDLPQCDIDAAMRVLGHHDLYYPKCAKGADGSWRGGKEQRKGTKPVGRQRNGQLMGSPLSFPILCLMNLLVFCLANPKLDSESAIERVLVNGDDMLYIGTQETWVKHKEISSSVGLKMSPGKAYIHGVYANANSTSFHCPIRRGSPAVQLGFLNTGLIFGKHKVMQDDREDRVSEPIESVMNVITEGCYGQEMKKDVLCMLLRLYRKDLSERTSFRVVERTARGYRTRYAHRNLFLAQSAGGFGVDPCGLRFQVTTDQKYLAWTRLEEKMSSGGPKEVYLEDELLMPVPDDLGQEWRLDAWVPWASSRPAGDSEITLQVDPKGYRPLRREWIHFVSLYARTGFRVIGTSTRAVWSC